MSDPADYHEMSLEELKPELEDSSLLELYTGDDEGTEIPYRDGAVDPDKYLQRVVEIQFDERYGAPFWREMYEEELDFDPREEIESFEELDKLPEAEEDELRQRPVEDFMPRLFHREDDPGDARYDKLTPDPQYFDMSKSSGTTGKKKEMPWRKTVTDEVVSWYNYVLDMNDTGDGDWLSVGPYGLWEKHHDRFTEERGAINHYTGIESKGLKDELRALGAVSDNPLSVLRPRTAFYAAKGLARMKPTLTSVEEDLRSEPVANISTAPPLVEKMYGMLQEDATVSSPEDIDTILLGGTAVDKGAVESLDEMYEDADIAAMYATSFTGPAFAADADEELAYAPLEPFMRFDVVDDAGETVEYGERGQVVFHRVAEGFFWPNQQERESAVRERPGEVSGADRISAIRPFED